MSTFVLGAEKTQRINVETKLIKLVLKYNFNCRLIVAMFTNVLLTYVQVFVTPEYLLCQLP